MRPRKAKSIPVQALIAAAARGELNESLARQLYRYGPEAVILALLAAGRRIAKQDARIAEQNARISELQSRLQSQPVTPSTPSAMVPVYTKPNAPRRRKHPGAKKGHPGVRRGKPTRIDRRVEHRLK